MSGTHVVQIRGGASPVVITRDGHRVMAGAVVVATNAPIHQRIGVHVKQAPYRTYAIATDIPRGSVPQALYWDLARPYHRTPYHYVRLLSLSGSRDLLIVGGEDHRTGSVNDGEERFTRLEAWTRERIPNIGRVRSRWSGQVMETMDGLAYIGRDPKKNIYIATGDSGQGMTHGTIAGMLLTDLISGRKNPWEKLYDPRRVPPRALPTLVREGMKTAKAYAGWLKGARRQVTRAIPRTSGVVIHAKGKPIAVYRDERGTLHAHSAVCTHLGCIVAWNSTEQMWDCPCHGSQFDADGHVINGPATSDLSPARKKPSG
jgi:Rieske Fe-S protein